jgi:DNA-binding NarL/FixJ family response regulator
MLYKEIADQLTVSHNTVHTLVRRIYEKLQVHTRREAIDRLQGRNG